MRVCMLSSVHSADDIRIVEKEADSRSGFGHPMPERIPVHAIELGPAAGSKDYNEERETAEYKTCYFEISN
jgi:hypothetical protein